MIVPGEYIISADGALVAAVIALSVVLSRTREKVARLEGLLAQTDCEQYDQSPSPPGST